MSAQSREMQCHDVIAARRKALELEPERAERHNSFGNALLASGRVDEAIDAYQAALRLKPRYSHAYNNLGCALLRAGRVAEAVTAHRSALDLAPDDATACNNLANALSRSGLLEEALATYDRAAALMRPGFEHPLVNKALLLMESGEEAQALQTLAAALSVNPRSARAWHLRAHLKRFGSADPDLSAMETLLNSEPSPELSLDERSHLHFALGKALLDAGNTAHAFEHLRRGNELERTTLAYDSDSTTRRIADVARAFTPERMRTLAGLGHPCATPVFVIGMPRSGTTLVEQILASHPDVHGAGELTVLPDLIPGVSKADPVPHPPLYHNLLAQLTAADLTRLGRLYERRVGELSPLKQRVVDKMPFNFLHAGFIHLILPNARIIHCRRDPADTCLSCYQQLFGGEVPFAYDLRELGLYYRAYADLMAHWRALLPAERFLEIRYESIVENIEHEARRLCEFCGLGWQAACLNFHRNRRPIDTASRYQVRQPIYRTSVGRWRALSPHLAPLLEALQGGADDRA